jgi:hypothetical protein
MFQTEVVEKIKNIHFMFCNFGRTKQTTDDNIIQHMRFAYWTSKATDTHSEYEILIAFPWQQWLRLNFTLYVHGLSGVLQHYHISHWV